MFASSYTRWITDGLIISGLSAYVYALAYYYERGIFEYFKIPVGFVTVNLSSFATVAVGVFFAIVLIFTLLIQFKRCLSSFLDDEKRRREEIETVISSLVMALSIVIGFMIIFKIIGPILVLIGLYLFSCFIEYILALEKRTPTAHHALFQFIRIVIYTSMMITGLDVSGEMGNYSARSRVNFTVLHSSPELAVLGKYGEYLFCSEFDKNTHQFSSKIKLIPLSEIKEFDLHVEEIGPLSPMPDSIVSSPIKSGEIEKKPESGLQNDAQLSGKS